jgi:hypothetical protein
MLETAEMPSTAGTSARAVTPARMAARMAATATVYSRKDLSQYSAWTPATAADVNSRRETCNSRDARNSRDAINSISISSTGSFKGPEKV